MNKVYAVDVYNKDRIKLGEWCCAFESSVDATTYADEICSRLDVCAATVSCYKLYNSLSEVETLPGVSDYVLSMDVRGNIKSCAQLHEITSHAEYIKQSEDDSDISFLLRVLATDEADAKMKAEGMRKRYIKDRFNL